ncbi:MAG: hypothetical protein ACFFE6_02710 [Candidatus Thorarchaeota archaeon]
MSLEKGILEEKKIKADSWKNIQSFVRTFIVRNRISLALFVTSTITVILASLFYLQTMLRWTTTGFPLDDSWIHVEFARSIFEGRPWEYSPGWPSTGSTSPLWAIVLSPLFFTTSNPETLILQIYTVSIIFYISSAFLAGLIVRDYTENIPFAFISVIGFVLIPRGTWLMLSGMESPLFIFLIFLGIYFADKPGWKYDIMMGVIGGLLFLTRPEGMLFMVVGLPIRFLFIVKQRELNKKRLVSFGAAALATCIIAFPWIFHCLSVTGFPLSDTFYTKSGEITQSSVTIWIEFWIRTLSNFPCLILGLFGGIVFVIKGRLYPWAFVIAMMFVYFQTVPYSVLVNNARYMTPLISVLTILSLAFIGLITNRLQSRLQTLKNELSYTIVSVTLILLLIIPTTPFFVWQADFYGNSVKNINEMQVTIGHWIYENTPPNASFAIFDAGAIRFFGNRTVFDIALLVTPELAHGNFSVTETFEWLQNHSCNYIVAWSQWFRVTASFVLDLRYTELFRIILSDNVICAGPEMSVFSLNWNQSARWSSCGIYN